MLFKVLHNLLFFFKNLGLLEFTPVPCSSLSPNLSHLHCEIVYSSAKLLWKVRPETISASTCFPKLILPKKEQLLLFRTKFWKQQPKTIFFFSFHFTAFCFQLPLSLISLFLFLFSHLPLSLSPSAPQTYRIFPWGLHQGNKQHKVGILLSCHLPVLMKKKINSRTEKWKENKLCFQPEARINLRTVLEK